MLLTFISFHLLAGPSTDGIATYLMLLLSLLMSNASLEHEIALGSKGISIQQTINGEISKYRRNLGPFFYLPGTIKLFSLYFLFLPLCGKVKESYPKVNKFFPSAPSNRTNSVRSERFQVFQFESWLKAILWCSWESSVPTDPRVSQKNKRIFYQFPISRTDKKFSSLFQISLRVTIFDNLKVCSTFFQLVLKIGLESAHHLIEEIIIHSGNSHCSNQPQENAWKMS